ncbi:MAG: heme ABC exporter ATP-binding protein CcmA [Pseudomonadota bacterium]
MMLKVTDLAVARGGLRVLGGLSFDLAAGHALLLRGPNGIGKTTLLRTLAGLQPPLSGHVEIPSDSLAYAGHLDGVKPTLSVVENLAFWASIFGSASDKPMIKTALEAFNLDALQDRPAGRLSAGQKRRLGLARLMVARRKLWLLDEPTVSLDADARALFEAVINTHLAGGGAVLAATHLDLHIAPCATLDLTAFRATFQTALGFDEAFL